jgi:bifunctional non-homologous end joining protein LigD
MARTAAAPENDALSRYAQKRDFARTPEPEAARATKKRPAKQLSFVVQKHDATRLHYDFRLELDGVLLSWAVPKGPSFDPVDKRMAVHVEDHPVSYGSFEGTIPKGQYGAGSVIVWDRGTWEPVGDPRAGMKEGKLVFDLHGEKLAGRWELVRIRKPDDRQDPWLMFKKRDAWARPRAEYDVVSALPDSVIAKPLGLVEEREPRSDAAAAEAAPAATPIDLSKAEAAELPKSLSPQLATASRGTPGAGHWLYEVKFDGYRLMSRIDAKGKARLITRGGHDWTAKLEPLRDAVEALGLKSSWLDGEIVVLDEAGNPHFNALQNAFDRAKTEAIVYFLFDLPFLDGHDLRKLPLASRRALLAKALEGHASERLRLSSEFTGDAASLLEAACKMKLEGLIAKRADAPYESKRTDTWLKLKCGERQEFVIGGFTDRAGSDVEVGSLLLGVHDDGKLRYVGNVGTGWNGRTAQELKTRLTKLEIDKSPFEAGDLKPGRWSRRSAGGERWVEPRLVAEVSFAEWTPDGNVRHAKFEGLREDKPATAVTREASTAAAKKAATSSAASSKIKISNPDRVIDPSTGLKKIDLVRYYESVAEWLLPHLRGRPVSFVRGPQGITGQLFFQKHPETRVPGVTELDPKLWPEHAALMQIDSAEALVSAAQMNVIEFHTWNATSKKIGQPDRMVFDLDPGEGTAWPKVKEAALLTRTLLDELGLASFLKTSGGKGLHVVVPLTPKDDWDTVKDFSQAVVQHLAQTIPDRFVAKSGPANRVGKLFVDYIRNTHGATTAAAFSARARPGLGVSMPIEWDGLSDLKSGAQWTIANAREHLSFQSDDPWAAYWTTKQTIAKAMKKLGYKPQRKSSAGASRSRADPS